MQEELLAGYNVHPSSDREAMLRDIGVTSIEGLFESVDTAIRLNRPLELPDRLPEWELTRHLRALASRNETTETFQSYLGGGAYAHYIPEVVRSLSNRGELLTAYTPYQPEMSQGLLRVLFDFQSLMARLLGLPSVNCSVYDGATALAESCWMACRVTGHRRLIVASNLWPDHLEVLQTYMKGRQVELEWIPSHPESGQIDLEALAASLADAPTSGIVLQNPNRFGVLEQVAHVIERCQGSKALVIVSCYPMALGCLKSPGTLDADIVCCEAQSLGLELNAGGPYLGVIATKEAYESHLPGRIVGVCSDLKGEEAFALIKESREQHVARHEATSHICSNQALMALRTSIYLSALGDNGFRKVAALNVAKAHYLQQRLTEIQGVRAAKSGPFFNEFLLELPCATSEVLSRLEQRGFFGGVDFSTFEPETKDRLLIAVTETKSRSDLDQFADALAEVVATGK